MFSRATCTSWLAGVVTLLSEGVMLSTTDNVGCLGEAVRGALLTEMSAARQGWPEIHFL